MVRLTIESLTAISSLINKAPDSVEAHEMRIGKNADEPCLLIADSIMRYATVMSKESIDPLAAEYITCMASGLKGLLNYQGCVAMERNISDSKSVFVIQDILEQACRKMGIDYHELC